MLHKVAFLQYQFQLSQSYEILYITIQHSVTFNKNAGQ